MIYEWKNYKKNPQKSWKLKLNCYTLAKIFKIIENKEQKRQFESLVTRMKENVIEQNIYVDFPF